MALGKYGIWRRHQEGTGPAPEIEAAGFSAIWVGGSPTLDQVRPFLELTSSLTVLSGVVNVWRNEPADVASSHAQLRAEFGERYLLGIGIGHPEATSEYQKPLTKMRKFLDGLDSAEQPVPKDERVLAALGPKMIDLAVERSLGTHPYFVPPEHTRFAREHAGAGALVAPEVTVVVEPDPEAGRRKARDWAAHYLELTNYTNNLLRFGFTERDIADGGSDRLIDTVIPHGSTEQIGEALQVYFEAGADHVCLQPVGGELEHYRALARALL